MAKPTYGIFGPARGRLGNLVIRRWKGVDVVQAYNPMVTNPKTQKQTLHRTKFAKISKMAGALQPVLKVGLGEIAKKRNSTEIGTFIKYNWGCMQGNTVELLSFDYEHSVVSQGPLTGVNFASPQMNGHVLDITFNSWGNFFDTSDHDYVYLALYSEQSNFGWLSNPVLRMDENMEITVPEIFWGETIRVWGFVKASASNNPLRDDCSKSQYLGTIEA